MGRPFDIDAFLNGGETPEPERMVAASVLGDWLGLTADHCRKLARDGKLPRDASGTFPLRAAVRAYCGNQREGARGRPLADPGLAGEKERLTRENADKVALQNAKARGDLIPATAVRAAWLEIVTDLRARLLAVPSRVAARLGLERAIAASIDAEIRAAMADIAADAGNTLAHGVNTPDSAPLEGNSAMDGSQVAQNDKRAVGGLP